MGRAIITTQAAMTAPPRPRVVAPRETELRYPTPAESFAGVEHLFLQWSSGRLISLGQATEEVSAIRQAREAIRQEAPPPWRVVEDDSAHAHLLESGHVARREAIHDAAIERRLRELQAGGCVLLLPAQVELVEVGQ